MYQFGVKRKNAAAKELKYDSGKRMVISPASNWLGLLVAGMLLLTSLAGVNATPVAETKSFIEACQVQHNITAEELELLPADPSPEDIDKKYKCYADCLLNGMGFLDKQGKIDLDSMHKWGILNDDSYESMLECKAANDMEEDPCEYSFGIMLCAQMIQSDMKMEEGKEVEEEEELEEIDEERRK